MVEERERVKRAEKEPYVVTLDIWGSFEKFCNRFGGKERCAKVRPWLSKLGKRLEKLTPHQTLALTLVVGVLFLLLGSALGALLATRQQPSEGESPAPSTPTPQSVTRTGVLRKFKTPQDGIEFYLEGQDDTQVLLDLAGWFDSSFVQKIYEGTAVTIEGTMTKSADGSKDILRIEKIVIKY